MKKIAFLARPVAFSTWDLAVRNGGRICCACRRGRGDPARRLARLPKEYRENLVHAGTADGLLRWQRDVLDRYLHEYQEAGQLPEATRREAWPALRQRGYLCLKASLWYLSV